jgi:hypothetical protein
MTIAISGTTGITLDGQFNSASTFGFKNRIINGAMVIDQRNAGASVTPTSGATYTLDRWSSTNAAASKYSVQQNAGSVTPPVGFTKYLGVTSLSAYSITAGDYFLLLQKIEGFNTADLAWGTANASAVTLSFKVYSSLTGTFGGAIGNSAQNRSYPFSYSVSSANTWTTISVTIAGDTSGTWVTDNGVGIQVFFGLGVGSTFSGTAGAWAGANYNSATGATSVVGTNGATFYITGVELEKGSTATSFDYRPYGTEFMLCQRYYQIANNAQAGTAPANETDVVCALGVKVDMRADPTIAIIAGVAFHRPGIAFYAASAVSGPPSAKGLGYTNFTIAAGAGAGTQGQIVGITALSSEL